MNWTRPATLRQPEILQKGEKTLSRQAIIEARGLKFFMWPHTANLHAVKNGGLILRLSLNLNLDQSST